MIPTSFFRALDIASGLALICAFVVLWRRPLAAQVRALAVQGSAVALVAVLLGIAGGHAELVVVGLVVAVLKGVAIPWLLLRLLRRAGETREAEPLINVPASLLIGAALTLVAYGATRYLVVLATSPESRSLPIGFAIVLLGVLVLVARQKALTQIVGFLLAENGISLVAFLAAGGVPVIVELGVTLDLLLAVLVLQVLATRMHAKFGGLDLDQLRELHD